MKILVIGGTQFVGRAIVEHLIDNGDEVTLFHRGRTNPDLFSAAHHILGDRNEDLSGLDEGRWDVTIDPSAYFPRQVRVLASALGDRGGRYVHISSVSAYDILDSPGATEDSPLARLDDPSTEVITGETYGGLKALCEAATHESFGPGGIGWSGETPSVVRPTYVAGPHDHTGRFTWWVKRIARGGIILAPGPRENPFQSIDVRDVANFVGLLASGTRSGVFHVSGPVPPFSFEDFLSTVVAQVGPDNCDLKWIDAQRLLDAGLSVGDFPLWEGLGEDRHVLELDSSCALSAGLKLRPLSETIRDVFESELADPTLEPRDSGLSSARESELLETLS
jgi:2'-hydroxyisoflavone reductase